MFYLTIQTFFSDHSEFKEEIILLRIPSLHSAILYLDLEILILDLTIMPFVQKLDFTLRKYVFNFHHEI